MSEQPLLLSPAKSGILVERNPIPRWLRFSVSAIGIFVVLLGGADIVTRFGNKYLQNSSLSLAIGPVIALQEEIMFPVAAEIIPATTTPILPARIQIEKIGVNAEVEAVALKDDNRTMAAPSSFEMVAWYEPGVAPGETGRAVFAGHLNSPILGREGIFSDLSDVENGDTILISDAHGRTLTYRVYSIAKYAKDLAPTEEIFRKEGSSEIVLVTCEGQWNPELKTFDKRLVVVARLVL